MRLAIRLTVLLLMIQQAYSQAYTPRIENCPCTVKMDPRLISRCGYLVVPENRNKPQGRSVKIPFLFLRKPDSDSIRNMALFSTGGPGYSTIANFDSIPYNSGFFDYGGFIAFDQRGTKKSLPCLDCPEVQDAIRKSYRENRSRDSLVKAAVLTCRKKWLDQGIDLSAYNTIESAADIADLRLALGLDSLVLSGISYSGGLMLTVVRNHPEAVRALLLNSPLPGFVNYEEDGLLNINEALDQVFANCEKDSTARPEYIDLRTRFHDYFTSIRNKEFYISYREPGQSQSYQIRYGHDELLDAIVNRLNTNELSSVPFVINELIKGNHGPYIKEVLDDHFRGNPGMSYGMRLSMYCSEQIAYANPELIRKQDSILPWLAGYRFNDVDHPVCDCWNVKPEPSIVKTPVYSNIPVLIGGGDGDPWCRPFYYRKIKRYMPNSQLLIMHNQGHGTRFTVQGIDYLKVFMSYPYKKITPASHDVSVE